MELVFVVVLVIIAFSLLVGLRDSHRRLERQVAALSTQVDRQLAAICDHLGIDPHVVYAPVGEGELPGEFYAFLHRGKKIQAIKIYRQVFACDLATAKAAVDTIARERGF